MNQKVPFNSMSEFLRWNFENPASDRVLQAFNQYYSRYISEPDGINYVWEHYDTRSLKLVEQASLGKKVIEIGCGIGMNSIYAAMHGGCFVGVEVKNFDIDVAKEQLAYIRNSFDVDIDCTFLCGDATKLGFEDTFDVIFMQEAFHHIEPRDFFVNWLKATVSSNGGRIVFQESNALNPFVQAFLFKVRGFETVKNKTDPHTGVDYSYGNERVISAGRLSKKFKSNDFKVSRVRYFRILPTELSKNEFLVAVAKLIESSNMFTFLFRFLFLHYELEVIKQS